MARITIDCSSYVLPPEKVKEEKVVTFQKMVLRRERKKTWKYLELEVEKLEQNKRQKRDETIGKKGFSNDVAATASAEPNDPIHAIMPPEVRCMVLGYLYEWELLALRVISKKWKSTVDSILKTTVTIDGTEQGNFNGRCSLSMKSCKLVSLQYAGFRHLFKAKCPKEVHVLNGIGPIIFQELLSQWTQLTKLEVCWRSMMKNLLYDDSKVKKSSKVMVLPNLRSLKVGVLISDKLAKAWMKKITANLAKITSFEYPALADFQVVFVSYQELHAQERHFSVLLPFIKKHAKSLESVEFALRYASLRRVYPDIHPRHVLFCTPSHITPGNKSPLGAFEEPLIMTKLQKPTGKSKEWMEMLHDTRKLEVAINTRFLNWTIRHLAFFNPTITSYAKFLRCIDLMNVTIYDSGDQYTATPLDFEIFNQCSQLEELRVYRAPIVSTQEDEHDPHTEIINFQMLPTTMKELIVDGLQVSSADILGAVKSLHLLSSFCYFQCQIPPHNGENSMGINWEILEAITEHENLNYVRVHVNSTLTRDNCFTKYDALIKANAVEFGWNTNGLKPNKLHVHEVMLTKGNSFLK